MSSLVSFPPSRTRMCCRGDVAILYVYFTLLIITISAFSLAIFAGIIRVRARDIAATSDAFFAGDVGIERARGEYVWSHLCNAYDDQPVPNTNDAKYTVKIDDGASGCPTIEEVNTGAKPLCIETRGKTQNGTVQRRIVSDTDSVRCNR